jgi:hypothetical protein
MKKAVSRFGAIAGVTVTAVIFLTSVQSRAQEERWSVSASNWMQYWYNQAQPTWIRSDTLPPEKVSGDSLNNRFSVDFNFGDFYAGAWLRTYEPNFTGDANEKITQRYLGWHQDGIAVHVGNFYETFDRGLTLNAFLDDAVYFDNNLDGIKVSGTYDHFDFDALSGRGFKFQLGQNEFTSQREYTIRAVRGALKPITGFKYGLSYVLFKQNSTQQFQQSDDVSLISVNHEINKGPFDVYGEYAFKDGNTTEEEKTDGDGTYLSASYSHRLFSVYGEYKNIFRLLYPGNVGAFNTPPPVSHQGRTIISLNSFVPGEVAYQIGTLISPSFDLNFDLAFSESHSRGYSILALVDSVLEYVPASLYLAEKYAGVRWSPIDKIVLNSHWDRIDYSPEDEIETYFDGYYYLDPVQTVSFSAYRRSFLPTGGGNYHEDYLTLGYSRDFIEVTIGGSRSNNQSTTDPEKLAFIEATAHYKTHELSVFHGGERGGLVCSSGICSTHPTFQGSRITLLSRF